MRELSRITKSFKIELRPANWIGRINFVRLNVSNFDIVQILQVFKVLFSQKLFDMNEGLFPDTLAVLLFLHLIFPRYYCSIDLKRQSEHSGPRLDTSSLVFFLFHCSV